MDSPGQVLGFLLANWRQAMQVVLPTLGGTLLKWGLIGLGLWLLLGKPSLGERICTRLTPLLEQLLKNKTRFLTVAFLLLLILAALLSYTVRQHLPDNTDSAAQFFHAKIFRMGKLYVSAPRLEEFFSQPFMIINQGKWYSQYTPAHIFFLMLGLGAGMPWLVNPLLSAASLLLLYQIARRLYDDKTACLAVALFIFSPLINFYAAGFMNCVTSLFFTLLFLLYLIKSEQENGLANPLLCGLFLGGIANVRPLTALTISLPFALYWLYLTWRTPRLYLKKLLMIALGLCLGLSVLFTFNYLTNGKPFLFGAQVFNQLYFPGIETIGFGKGQFGALHTPFRALVHALDKLNKLNGQLFGWFIPSLTFAFLFWLLPAKKKTWDYLQLAPIFCLVFAYFFYAFLHVRYFYSLLPFFILLSARGLLSLGEGLTAYFNRLSLPKLKGSLYILLAACILYSFSTNIMPDLLSSSGQEKNQVYNLVKARGLKQALVFMPGGYGGWGVYMRGFVHNSPGLDSEVIYAKDLGGRNRLLMYQYPARSYYRYYQIEGKGRLEKL